VLILMAAEGAFRIFSDPTLRFRAMSVLVAINSIGFIAAFFLLRPSRHSQRWPPYITMAVIGAATVANIWLVDWIGHKLPIRVGSPFLVPYICGSLIFTAFCTSSILLLLYRVTIDRSISRRS